MYKITSHTRSQARKYGYIVRPSKNKGKKIAIFKKIKKDGKVQEVKLADVGALGYGDYGTFIRTKGKEFADKRQPAFFSRFRRLPDIKNGKITTIFWSRFLLW